MATSLRFEPVSSNARAAAFIAGFMTDAQRVVDSYVEEWGLAAPDSLTVILADDFTSEVRNRMDPDEAAGFTSDRLGGEVAAKNLSDRDDPTGGFIVINSSTQDYADDTNGGQAFASYTLAHELIHPPLNRTRFTSGAAALVPLSPRTPSEFARGIVRDAIDEFRCDLTASAILKQLAGEDARRCAIARAIDQAQADMHFESTVAALDDVVAPGWTDFIDANRAAGRDSQTIWGVVVTQTNQMISLLAHADASAQAAGRGEVLAGDLYSHPGVAGLLARVWTPLLDFVRQHPVLPSVTQFADVEEALLGLGEKAVLGLWHDLGLRYRQDSRGNLKLSVTSET